LGLDQFPRQGIETLESSRSFRVLVTRSSKQASALSDHLRALGCEPILIPTIETIEPASFELLDQALSQLQTFQWLIFTSANAVNVYASRMRTPVEAKSVQIAAIGAATARALEAAGLKPDLIPPQAVAESLTEALLPHVKQPNGTATRFLLIRAEEAREHLPETLRAAGAEVTIAPAYRTVVPESSIEAIRQLYAKSASWPDAITFTSVSTVRNLLTLLEAAEINTSTLNGLNKPTLASIGPITSHALREEGYEPDVESPEASVATLAEILVKYLREHD
jgi:uroporphyrinogen-III synthase